MIGRTDIVIPRPVEDDGKRTIMRVLRAVWPDAVMEDAEGAEPPAALAPLEASALPDEFFVYRDAVALEAWNEEGATDENADSMIHLLLGPTAITCVVDPREGAETRAIAGRIERALEAVELPMVSGTVYEGLDDPANWIEAA